MNICTSGFIAEGTFLFFAVSNCRDNGGSVFQNATVVRKYLIFVILIKRSNIIRKFIRVIL